TTGVKQNGEPVNKADAWWTSDEGQTWHRAHAAAWNASHADGLTVHPTMGLVLASGNTQEKNVYRLTAEPKVGPHVASLTGWWRPQYRGTPVRGFESAGPSVGRNLAAGVAPAVGAAL